MQYGEEIKERFTLQENVLYAKVNDIKEYNLLREKKVSLNQV